MSENSSSVQDRIRLFERRISVVKATYSNNKNNKVNNDNDTEVVLRKVSSELDLEKKIINNPINQSPDPHPGPVSTKFSCLNPNSLFIRRTSNNNNPNQLDHVSNEDILFDSNYLKHASKRNENVGIKSKSKNSIIDIMKCVDNLEVMTREYLEANKSGIDCALEELVISEKKHVENLRKIVEEFLPQVKICYGLFMCESIFGNVIEEIYQKTVEFYGDLLIADLDLNQTSKILSQKMEPLYQLYTVYSREIQNLDKTLETYSMLQEKNQGKLKLNKGELQEALSRVSRRITEYDILIKNLKQQIEKERGFSGVMIDKACLLIEIYNKKSNMCGYLADLKNCSHDFNRHGDLILVNDFYLRGKPKMSLRVFLFKEMILIARVKDQECKFIDSIPVNDLTYGRHSDHIELKKTGNAYIIYSDKKVVMQNWQTELENIMYHQVKEKKVEIQRRLSTASQKSEIKSRAKCSRYINDKYKN